MGGSHSSHRDSNWRQHCAMNQKRLMCDLTNNLSTKQSGTGEEAALLPGANEAQGQQSQERPGKVELGILEAQRSTSVASV